MATANEQQGALAEEINRSVVAISAKSNETRQAAKQIAHANEALSHVATTLHDEIARFHT